MHNAWVTMSGEKMWKSLGNSVLVSEMVKQWRPIVLRYYLGTPHYRSTIEYHEGSLREAEATVERIEGFLTRALRALPEGTSTVPDHTTVPEAFAASMDDDLNVSGALAVSDEATLAAVAFAFRELKLVVEPGGAVALAAILSGAFPVRGRTVVAVLSGGNIDEPVLRQALAV